VVAAAVHNLSPETIRWSLIKYDVTFLSCVETQAQHRSCSMSEPERTVAFCDLINNTEAARLLCNSAQSTEHHQHNPARQLPDSCSTAQGQTLLQGVRLTPIDTYRVHLQNTDALHKCLGRRFSEVAPSANNASIAEASTQVSDTSIIFSSHTHASSYTPTLPSPKLHNSRPSTFLHRAPTLPHCHLRHFPKS